MGRSLNRCRGGILLPTTRFFHLGAMISPHEDFLFITTPYDPSLGPPCYTLLSAQRPPQQPSWPWCAHSYAVPFVYAWSIRYIDWLYACLCRVSLGLTPKNLCVRRRWSDYQEIVRPPTGGQMTFKRLCRRRPLPNLTITYRSLPSPMLTVRNRLVY